MEKQGKVLGVPYDFRQLTYRRMKSRMWNPDDERIFTPRSYGIGWDINFYQLKLQYPWAFYVAVAAFVVSFARWAHKFFTSED
jgi:hypothetical protein